MDDIKFSIIITAYNAEKWVRKSIKSIINQSLDFKENVEIILINEGSKDNTEDICKKYASHYPNNINYISKKYEGNGISRTLGIKYAKGEYITFLDAEDYISKNALKRVLAVFEKNKNINIVTINSNLYESSINNPILKLKYDKTRVIDLFENPEFFQAQAMTCFFKVSSIEDAEFTEQLNILEDLSFVNQLLLDNPKIGISSNCKYYIRSPTEKMTLLSIIPKSEDFNENERYSFKNLVKKSLDKYGNVPLFVQNAILFYFNDLILNESIDEKLNKKEIKSLNQKIKGILRYIDEENIYNHQQLDVRIKTFLLFLKNDYSYPKKDRIRLTKSLKLDTVYIDIYEIINDELHILANINSIAIDDEVEAYVNGKKIETKVLEFPQRERYYLNERYLVNHTFEFRLKLDENEIYDIKFKSNISPELNIDFSRPCNFSKVVGYSKTKKYLSVLDSNCIQIKKKKTTAWLRQEFKALTGMLKNRVSGFETAIPIRLMYLLLYPFYRNRRIWFYMDFPTIADDNGMHLFKYSIDQNEKGIKKYFIIDKNTDSYKKMKKIGPVIAYHSMKHRILGLFAEKIITSHPDNNYIYAFWGHYPNFAGILKSSTLFLQHGITLNNISGWLNKYDKNLDFLLTASKKEYDSLFKYYYNYDEEIIQLLGFPRFDNLKDEKTKTLLLMPSWRRYLSKENKFTISNSSYFKTYNSLINNPKLIKKAKEYGYEIIFRPHPHVYQFIDLFDANDFVKIDYTRGSYQDLFKKGALLITDYSSVAFDFAYLKKPVLYYQYGEDYHFNLDESYFDYDTMGFGEVCASEEELIELIEEYMKNDCKMKEKHVKNVEDYFIFTDRNNCKRVHEAILKIPPRG